MVEPPNESGGINVTYIQLSIDWMYLVVVLDWHSHFVVSRVQQSLEIEFVLKTVKRALAQALSGIFNGDGSSRFANLQYKVLLQEVGTHISKN